MRTYDFTERHARRYLDWLQREGLLYLRYRSRTNKYYYYSAVRKKDETGQVRQSVSDCE